MKSYSDVTGSQNRKSSRGKVFVLMKIETRDENKLSTKKSRMLHFFYIFHPPVPPWKVYIWFKVEVTETSQDFPDIIGADIDGTDRARMPLSRDLRIVKSLIHDVCYENTGQRREKLALRFTIALLIRPYQ